MEVPLEHGLSWKVSAGEGREARRVTLYVNQGLLRGVVARVGTL